MGPNGGLGRGGTQEKENRDNLAAGLSNWVNGSSFY